MRSATIAAAVGQRLGCGVRMQAPGSRAMLMAIRRASSAVNIVRDRGQYSLRIEVRDRLPVGVPDDIAARARPARRGPDTDAQRGCLVIGHGNSIYTALVTG